jgi:CheY-like chemotaxis protein
MAKILLVEDDTNLREIYEARLQAEGYAIVSAKDGEDALVVAKQEHPDLIISDVMMPRISGFEMLDILRNTEGLKNVKIIMLTALGQAEDKTRADALGADRYLVKSQVTLEDIVKAAQELLASMEAPATTATPVAVSPTPAPVVQPVAPPQSVAVAPVAPAMAPARPATPPAMPRPSNGLPPIVNDVIAPGAIPLVSVAPATPPMPPRPIVDIVPPATAKVATPVAVPATTVPMPPDVASPIQPVSAPATPTAASRPQQATMQPTSDAHFPGVTETQTTSDEEAVMKAQIENFVQQPGKAPTATPAATVTQPAATVISPTAAPVQPQPAAPIAPQPVAPTPVVPAVQAPTLVQPTPSMPPVPAPTLPPAAPTDSNDDGVTIAHKKIISPIDADIMTPPDFNALLAKEGIENMDDEGHPYLSTAAQVINAPNSAQPDNPAAL